MALALALLPADTHTLLDRCDGDAHGSEHPVALVFTSPDVEPLRLCLHHLNQHRPALVARGYAVIVAVTQ